jgi:hypothetical protein
MSVPSNQLAVVRPHVEPYYTIVRFEGHVEGGIVLIPRQEIYVGCLSYSVQHDSIEFEIAFASGLSMTIEAAPIADFEKALRDENFELLNSSNFDAELVRRGDHVDLTCTRNSENPDDVWRLGVCTVELTADAWATLRDKMLAVIDA